MKLNDEVIAHIAKLLQLAILTGTDVIDNLRMIRLQTEKEELFLHDDYVKQSEENEKRMLAQVQELANQQQ
jgi:hypothetical protein